jgi:cytochrome c oxidase subunit 1
MPRRVYTYVHETGWGDLNMLATIGGGVMGVAVVIFISNVIYSLLYGPIAEDNPWGGDTLEWSVSSPPPSYNFQYIPVVQGRSAMWDATPDAPAVTGLHIRFREMLATSIHDAAPEHRYQIPNPSFYPLLLGLVTFGSFTTFIFTPWAIPAGMALSFVVFMGWFWSNSHEHRPPKAPPEDNPVYDDTGRPMKEATA